ncbi:MAG: ThuA domain-containing protein [Verrucomicrobiota bacterium]
MDRNGFASEATERREAGVTGDPGSVGPASSSSSSRREFMGRALAAGLAGLGGVASGSGCAVHRRAMPPLRVLMWDERQPAQKQAYPQGLGTRVARHLGTCRDFEVSQALLDDPGQGLSRLGETDVVVWWGHVRHAEIETATALRMVEQIRAGRLGWVALHSAHWSRPFVEAMAAIARDRALAALTPEEAARAVVTETELLPRPFMAPQYQERRSPSVLYKRPPTGPVEVRLVRPNCCFPAYRGDGKPSEVRVRMPGHPVAKGLPPMFTIPQTEMYDEPFHVPDPDEVVLEEHWATGEWFRSGAAWRLGKGRVFYFRPGHETYPVFDNPWTLKVVENAVRWAGRRA